jgi:hypothetical protein
MLEEKISPALRVADLRILRAGLSKMGGELRLTGSRMRPVSVDKSKHRNGTSSGIAIFRRDQAGRSGNPPGIPDSPEVKK